MYGDSNLNGKKYKQTCYTYNVDYNIKNYGGNYSFNQFIDLHDILQS